jgi:hypothetical protein
MEAVSSLINAFVVVAVGAFLTYVTVDRSRQLRRDLEGDIARLNGGITELRTEIRTEISRLDARVDAGFNAVRSDITAVALAVGARAPSRETGKT